MFLLKLIISIYLIMGFTWFWYLAVMHLKHNKDKLNKVNKFFGYPWFIIAVVGDVLFNWVIGSIVFVEIPKEMLFTDRVSRHLTKPGKIWRRKLASFFCKNMLDPFDPSGDHCG